jgi:hypothetical protein
MARFRCGGAKGVVVALPVLNADTKPDVNRVAFVSIIN